MAVYQQLSAIRGLLDLHTDGVARVGKTAACRVAFSEIGDEPMLNAVVRLRLTNTFDMVPKGRSPRDRLGFAVGGTGRRAVLNALA